MINMLIGNESSVKAYKGALGKQIDELVLNDNTLVFTFTDKSTLTLQDYGQLCCGSRYFTCDDDLTYQKGATLEEVTLEAAPDVEGGGAINEITFMRVRTSKGMVVVSAHNEHSGSYGGFGLTAVGGGV
jgi:hypothetical protein